MNSSIETTIKKLFKIAQTQENDESKCQLISSRGFLRSCDIFDENPNSSVSNVTSGYDFGLLYPKTARNRYTKVYICNSAIPDFMNFFELLPHPFVLISGDCDVTVPNDIYGNLFDFSRLLNSDKLIHWFSQNCVVKHPKLTKLPIGLDYHTMKTSPILGPIMSSRDQENTLLTISNAALPFHERKHLCYINFMNRWDNKKYGNKDRKDALIQIPGNLLFIEKENVPRIDSWINMSRCAFVISPHGNGYDCHRTWEAIALGCIPIVKKSSIDSLYDDLPVLIVDNWFNINDEMLEMTIEKYKNMSFCYEKMTLKYWTERFESF
jgi:hypothetical protein